jgi:hypothetical protein
LNGIFKSSTSPIRVNLNDLTETKIMQPFAKFEKSERATSQTKYSQNIESEARISENNRDKILKNNNSSDMKVANAHLVHEVIEGSENCEKITETKEHIINSPLKKEPQIALQPKIYQERSNEYEINIRNEVTKSPDNFEKAKTVNINYSDTYSNFGVSTSGANKDHYVIEDYKYEDTKQIGDIDILKKEYELGVELLNKSVAKIDKKVYQSLLYNTRMSGDDYRILQIMLSLLFSIKHNSDVFIDTIESTNHQLRNYDQIIEMQDDFDKLIQMPEFNSKSTAKFRDSFVQCSSYEPTMESIIAIKEYLCEAFCLIDIVEELKMASKPSVKVYEESVKLESPQHEVAYQNEKTKATLASRNSDLSDIDFPADSSRSTITADIRSRYYKKRDENAHSEYSYDMPMQINKNASPKRHKQPKNKSKFLSCTPKVNRGSGSDMLKSKSTTKLRGKPTAIITQSHTEYANDYSIISQRKSPRKIQQ